MIKFHFKHDSCIFYLRCLPSACHSGFHTQSSSLSCTHTIFDKACSASLGKSLTVLHNSGLVQCSIIALLVYCMSISGCTENAWPLKLKSRPLGQELSINTALCLLCRHAVTLCCQYDQTRLGRFFTCINSFLTTLLSCGNTLYFSVDVKDSLHSFLYESADSPRL